MAQLNLLNSNVPHEEWNIILIQEPYLNKSNNTRASSAWQVIYPTSHLSNSMHTRSTILINRQLDTNAWHQLTIPDLADMSVVQLIGSFGKVLIFNIYNNCKNDDSMDVLQGYIICNQDDLIKGEDDHMIWAGNFNKHHPL
ncbi:hypothetical protein J132_08764 [Termitomyces sp. J132]|nr:hypothetical protein J132_08764 [Termitomyces sp. J132]